MMTLRIGRRQTLPVATLSEASLKYGRIRDESGEGGSTFPEGHIRSNDGSHYRVSYNGRVWHKSPERTQSVVLEAVYL